MNTTPFPDPGSGDSAAGPSTPLSRGELQDRAVKGALWTLLHTAVSLPLAFVVNILLARVLGVVDYGRLAYLTVVLTLVGQVISLGVGTGVIQFGAKAHASGRTEDVRSLLSASQAFRLFVSIPILSAVVLAIADIEPWLTAVAIVFGVVIPAVFGGALDCFFIESKTAQGAQNAMIVNLLTQAAVVAAVLALPRPDVVWAVRLVMGGVAVLMALPYASPLYRRALLIPNVRGLLRGFPPGFWRFALPAGAAGLLSALLSNRSEVMVLTWLSAVEAAGVFALAFGLVNHLFGPAQALLGPLIPAVAGLHEVDGTALGRAMTRTLRASATIVGLLVAGGLPALAHLIVPLYGEEYRGVAPVMLALGIVGGVSVVTSPVRAFVQARLSGWRLLVINLVAVASDLVLMLLLIPRIGVWGAVVGSVVAVLLQLVLLLAGELRSLGLTWGSAAGSGLPVALGILACLAAWAGSAALGLASVVSAFLAGILGVVLYVGAVRLARSGLASGDLDAIVRVLPGRLRPVLSPILGLCANARD